MSSFIGHGIAAIGIFSAGPDEQTAIPRRLWLIWLILVAWAPDIDYLVIPLQSSKGRMTHSILFCMLLPLLTVAVLTWRGIEGDGLRGYSLQVVTSSLSHLVLDLLVGVTPLPLLWPITNQLFKLPFGILPSAGGLYITNPLLWRNLLIETGVLLPVFLSVYLIRKDKPQFIPALAVIAATFAYWAFTLSR